MGDKFLIYLAILDVQILLHKFYKLIYQSQHIL